MKKGVGKRPEVEIINTYVQHRTATQNIVSALGYLPLLWSTVVLLGGFVGDLQLKDFWVVTGLSFLMAFKMVNIIDEELRKENYMEEIVIIHIFQQQKWNEAPHNVIIMMLRVVLGLKLILSFSLGMLFYFSPFVSLGFSLWRIAQRDYGDAGGGDLKRAKLTAALDIFYALILFQSLFAFYYVVILGTYYVLQSLASKHSGLRNWGHEVVEMYYSETERKFKKDEKLPGNWSFITYSVGLLQSVSPGSGDDHLWGARVLDQLFDNDNDRSVRQELLSSRLSINNLIAMIIGGEGIADNTEKRERATRIVARLASDLHITHFPGALLECICSLLESCKPQFTTCPPENPEQRLPDDKKDHRAAHTVVQMKHLNGDDYRGVKELVSQGLLILERLTKDEGNCTEIGEHQRLLSKITSLLSSHDLLNSARDRKKVEMLSRSLTVVSRLLTCPGDGAARLRQELASNMEATINLMGILESDREGAQELREQALEILTELAFHDSFTKLAFNKLFRALLPIFLEEKDGSCIVAEPDSNKSTRMRRKAGEALARLLPLRTAKGVNVADILSKQEAINLLTKVLDQILSSKMESPVTAVTGPGAVHIVAERRAPVFMSEEQSEERKFIAAMLSLAVVIRNDNVISKEDFARATRKDLELLRKLSEILEVNQYSMAECLRVVKPARSLAALVRNRIERLTTT